MRWELCRNLSGVVGLFGIWWGICCKMDAYCMVFGVWRSCHAFTSSKIFIARRMALGFSPFIFSIQSDFKFNP